MNINHIDLRHLRYFVAVAEELSFSRAALRLNISQPPLSQQIMDMEARLEVRLFRRTKRKVALTVAGNDLLPRARNLLRDMESGLRAVQAVSRGQTHELRIGTIYSAPLAPAFVGVIQRLRKIQPGVRFIFREMRSAPLLNALANSEIDAAFAWHITPPADKRMRATIVSEDALHLCVPSGHRLANKRSVAIEDLKDELLFLTTLQAKMPFAQTFRRLAQKKDVALNVSEEASHFSVIANLVAAGCGLGIVPDYIARLATSRVVCKKLQGVPPAELCMKLALLHLADSENPILAAFLAASGSTRKKAV